MAIPIGRGEGARRGLSLLTAVCLAGAVLGLGCAGDEAVGEKPVIRLHDPQSESIWLNNAIAKFIIEEGYE